MQINYSLDPAQSLAPFHFHTTGETTWKPISGEGLASLLASPTPPEFRTILGTSCPYPAEESAQASGVGYIGPFYADFDAETSDEVISQFIKFLRHLQIEHAFDLTQARLYASGKKGFHLEIPQACFLPALPAEGIPFLPAIYKEMAMAMYVDTLDLRVYSAKRGRMWRVPNRRRANGMYKVPIEPNAETFTLGPEQYQSLCGTPRPWPPMSPPTLNSSLGILFHGCREKIAKGAKRNHESTRIDNALRRRFNGKLPPSLDAIAKGAVQSPVGFNLLALQLAIVAHTVGMSEDQLVAECAGLLQRHASDGRYNTRQKRDAELRKQWRYVLGNPSYQVSVSGIRSVLPRGINTRDLRGL
jgi:hypothetical protein